MTNGRWGVVQRSFSNKPRATGKFENFFDKIESQTAKNHPSLILSTVFVFYGISRYLFLAFGSDEGGEPETLLLRDAHLIGSVVLFVLSVILAFSGMTLGFVN